MPRYTKSQYTKDIIGQVTDLKNFWSPRVTQFQNWYDLLSLVDENKVENLESFTSNDPRTTFNMALFLLTPDEIRINMPANTLNDSEQTAVNAVENLFASKWKLLEKNSYKVGQQGWLRYLNSLMLATGWYSVFALVDGDDFIADIWNPAQVYPWFDDRLGEAAHMYTISASTARYKVAKNDWDARIRTNTPIEVIDYWCYGSDGSPRNTIILDGNLVKDKTYPNLPCLPVYCSPVGGLPDTGIIEKSNRNWKQNIGQSILASNADVIRSYNRLLSFLIQLAKDTAQSPIVERGEGNGVVKSSDIGKRAVVWKVNKDTVIETLAQPGIPPEIPLQLQNARAMIQRGGFADGLFTGVDGSGYLQSLVSASAQQVLKPYNQAINHLLTDINNGWLEQIRNDGSIELDMSLPPEVEFLIDIEVSVPGDLIQRATTARQLDPTFKLSTTTTMDLLFPEIKDPNREMVLARKDKAMNSDIMATIDLATALEEQAEALEADGLTKAAQRYAKFSQLADQQVSQALGAEEPNGPPGQANAGMT